MYLFIYLFVKQNYISSILTPDQSLELYSVFIFRNKMKTNNLLEVSGNL